MDTENGYTKHSTVGSDEGQEDAQCLIEGGRHLLQDYLDHLHKSSNDQDEGDGLQILQAKGVEHELLYQPGDDGGQRQYKGYGCRHAQ